MLWRIHTARMNAKRSHSGNGFRNSQTLMHRHQQDGLVAFLEFLFCDFKIILDVLIAVEVIGLAHRPPRSAVMLLIGPALGSSSARAAEGVRVVGDVLAVGVLDHR